MQHLPVIRLTQQILAQAIPCHAEAVRLGPRQDIARHAGDDRMGAPAALGQVRARTRHEGVRFGIGVIV